MIPRPTIGDIQERVTGHIESALNQDVPAVPKAVFPIVAGGVGGVWQMLYTFGVWCLDQLFPQRASMPYLGYLGDNKKVPITEATTWIGEAEITYTDSPVGGWRDVLAGEQFRHEQTQVIYVATATAAIDNPAGSPVALRSAVTGEIADLAIGDELTILDSSDLPGEVFTVSDVSQQGSDVEDTEVYRQRVIDAYQKQPQGGALADYEKWAEETPHVINAYPYPGANPTEVTVYIEVDDETDGIPTATEKTLALWYITYDPVTELASRKPVTDTVTVEGITRIEFDVGITGLSPDTSEIRSAIETALDAYFAEREPYIEGLSITRLDQVTLYGAIAIASEVAATYEAIFTGLGITQGVFSVNIWELAEGTKAKATYTWS